MVKNELKQFLNRNPSSFDQWIKLGYYKTPQGASQATKRMVEKEGGWAPRLIGTAQLRGTGREKKVFCNGWRTDDIAHEWWTTEKILAAWKLGMEVERGKYTQIKLPSGKIIEPDANVHGSVPVFVEVDLDTEGYDVIEEKSKKYAELQKASGQDVFTLWFAPTEARLSGIRERTDGLYGLLDSETVSNAVDKHVELEAFYQWILKS